MAEKTMLKTNPVEQRCFDRSYVPKDAILSNKQRQDLCVSDIKHYKALKFEGDLPSLARVDFQDFLPNSVMQKNKRYLSVQKK
jgi:hypothetical protein